MTRAPWLLLAVGNPSRGDDALAPALLERLRGEGLEGTGEIELLTDFQLQVEHALDLQDRRAVLFVDAARPQAVGGAGVGAGLGASITPIVADQRVPPASHALRAQAVLHVARALAGRAPPAWMLAIEGRSFALGEGLSAAAERHLELALVLARQWLRERRAERALVDSAA